MFTALHFFFNAGNLNKNEFKSAAKYKQSSEFSSVAVVLGYLALLH